jgi:hypothetical protein
MSELIQARDENIRRSLLATVSALALVGYIASVDLANAQDDSRPTVWIELGGQLERLTGREDAFLPPFTQLSPTPGPYQPISPTEAQKSSIYSYGGEGKFIFQPNGSAWSFSAAVRYGRSNNNKHVHQQTVISKKVLSLLGQQFPSLPPYLTPTIPVFADFKAANHESHVVLDFQVGRDVGIGGLLSTMGFGIRMADFTSSSRIGVIARPEAGVYDFISTFYVRGRKRQLQHVGSYRTDFEATAYNDRSFRGVGPSVSWGGDIPLIGGEEGAITLDWGANAALLFGRQKSEGSHKTNATYHRGGFDGYGTQLYDHPLLPHDRSRSVVVPNVGFLADLSFRYPNAKVSFGYRTDMFFSAMDMGVDQRDTKDRTFHGPFATVSIGLGG